MPLVPLRVRFDDAAQLRAHLRHTKTTPVLLLARLDVEMGTQVHIELEVVRGPHYLTVEGVVAANGKRGCIVAIPEIGPLQGKQWLRRERRFPLGIDAIATACGMHERVQLRDVSFGGARLDRSFGPGTALEIRHENLELQAMVTWSTTESCGVRWVRTHGATRLSALKLLQKGVAGWDRIPLVSHPAACACCMAPAVAAVHAV